MVEIKTEERGSHTEHTSYRKARQQTQVRVFSVCVSILVGLQPINVGSTQSIGKMFSDRELK